MKYPKAATGSPSTGYQVPSDDVCASVARYHQKKNLWEGELWGDYCPKRSVKVVCAFGGTVPKGKRATKGTIRKGGAGELPDSLWFDDVSQHSAEIATWRSGRPEEPNCHLSPRVDGGIFDTTNLDAALRRMSAKQATRSQTS